MMRTDLDTPVQYLKGVGPKVAKLLKKLGIETIEDAVFFFPRSYEDRSTPKPIGSLQPSDLEIIKGEVISINHQLTRNRFSVLKAVISDRSGSIQAVWFNQPYLTKLIRKGMRLILSGKVEFSSFEHTLQFSVREFEIDTGVNPKIMPIYSLTDGLYPKKIRSIVTLALENHLDEIEEWLPGELQQEYKLAELKDSIYKLHFPGKLAEVEPARRRLAFDDFFMFQLGLALRRNKIKKERGIVYKLDQRKLNEFKSLLPFKLTAAQERVVTEILSDMQQPQPMNRLLQGDVGAGKTVVAAIAAVVAIQNGYQVALMAPTEILAQQHYKKLISLFRVAGTLSAGIKVKLLTSSTKRKTGGAKSPTYAVEEDIIIGTHALIQENVKFDRLGLVIIDEQHRFGVEQRASLIKKGQRPDVLVMTATPIPRSLALTLYGDLDRSVIDELPPGRTPIKTYYVPENKRRSSYEFIRSQVEQGRQVFVICPLVAESEKIDLKAAMDEADYLQKEVFPELQVGLIHGRMSGEEKDRIMKSFYEQKINILVSTTVIEVGIDIPNATVMVVEHAERFGLSQLHQLRGRIGRGSEQSHCFLMAEPKTPEARARIKAMLDSNDGFYLAEVDLKLRGPGEFYGTRQSGLPNFRVADIIKDAKILKQAREAAFNLIAADIRSARNIWQSKGKKIKGPFAGAALN